MIIHLVRHAEAIERTAEVPEEHRYLTPRGRKRFRKVAKNLQKLGIDPDVILTSPLVRAIQTADILAEWLRFKQELQIAPLLAPGFRPEFLDRLLSSHSQAKEIAIVGHEPDFGLLAQTLFSEQNPCTLPKGAVVSFKRAAGDQGKAVFLQLVTGGGIIVTSRSRALGRLQREAGKR
jgi:phosphohistidine phosphatase